MRSPEDITVGQAPATRSDACTDTAQSTLSEPEPEATEGKQPSSLVPARPDAVWGKQFKGALAIQNSNSNLALKDPTKQNTEHNRAALTLLADTLFVGLASHRIARTPTQLHHRVHTFLDLLFFDKHAQ
jgi:hypothetical protein